MNIFTLSYGLTLLKESFQLMMAHKKTLVYMCIAQLLVGAIAVIGYAHGFHWYWLWIDTLTTVFFIIPLMYHVGDIKRGIASSVSHNFDKIPLHWGAIVWSVLFNVFSISAFRAMELMVLPAAIKFFLIIGLFALGLLFEYMVVSVVLDNVSVAQGFSRSWSMIKQTMYSIISCLVGLIVSFILLIIPVSLILILFLLTIGLITSESIMLAHVGLSAEIAMLIVGICYSTVIGIFQTLLYLKYKKTLEPVENAVPVQEQ